MRMETNSDSKVCSVGIVADTQVQKPSNPERYSLIKTCEHTGFNPLLWNGLHENRLKCEFISLFGKNSAASTVCTW